MFSNGIIESTKLPANTVFFPRKHVVAGKLKLREGLSFLLGDVNPRAMYKMVRRRVDSHPHHHHYQSPYHVYVRPRFRSFIPIFAATMLHLLLYSYTHACQLGFSDADYSNFRKIIYIYY